MDLHERQLQKSRTWLRRGRKWASWASWALRSMWVARAAIRLPPAGLGIIFASIALGVVSSSARAVAQKDGDAAFVAENAAAMSKMMAAMTFKSSGDVDKDFVASMVPHHQGAIEMAEAELRHGHNEQLRRIAQEIIVDQTQEIAAMRAALSQKAATEPPK